MLAAVSLLVGVGVGRAGTPLLSRGSAAADLLKSRPRTKATSRISESEILVAIGHWNGVHAQVTIDKRTMHLHMPFPSQPPAQQQPAQSRVMCEMQNQA